MEILNHLFSALGRLMLWVSSVLVIEELTLGGLARLLLSRPFDGRGNLRRNHAASSSASTKKTLAVDSKAVQGEMSCSR